MGSKLHFTKCALAECLAEDIMPDSILIHLAVALVGSRITFGLLTAALTIIGVVIRPLVARGGMMALATLIVRFLTHFLNFK